MIQRAPATDVGICVRRLPTALLSASISISVRKTLFTSTQLWQAQREAGLVLRYTAGNAALLIMVECCVKKIHSLEPIEYPANARLLPTLAKNAARGLP